MRHTFRYTQKLTNILKKAEQTGRLTVGFLGGSITQGCNPSVPENAYVERVTSWLRERLPKVEVERINAGVGATGSLIGVHRVKRDIIAKKPDLVFVEFAANDVFPKRNTAVAYESLIRTILTELPQAAVVEIFMTVETGESGEEEQAFIAEHYQLPTVSYRHEIFSLISQGKYKWEDLTTDEVHPNDMGHELLKSLITELLEDAMKQEVDESFSYEIPDTTVYGIPYFKGKLIEFKDLKILEENGFRSTEENFRTINTGYEVVADQAKLKCEVEGKNVFLLYVKGIEKERAKIQIKVNDKLLNPIDTYFKDGWGNYPETCPLLLGGEKQKIVIEVQIVDDEMKRKLNLLGFLVS